jgi:hypothetical protein
MEPEETQDAPEVLETPEETTENQETTDEAAQTDEEKEALRKENEELKRKNAQLYERTQKAKEVKTISESGLSFEDFYALNEARVPKDDIPEVTEYAKLKGISVSEALNSTVVKSILADNAEKRATAAATATGPSRRATGKVSEDTLLNNARKGQLPDSDEEMQRLIKASFAKK